MPRLHQMASMFAFVLPFSFIQHVSAAPAPLFQQLKTSPLADCPGCTFGAAFARADLNADGTTDLLSVAVRSSSATLPAAQYLVVTLTHAGSAPTSTLLDLGNCVPSASSGIAAVDIDGDGKTDAIVPCGNYTEVLPGRGDGTFAAPIIGGGTITADLNGDGRPDFVSISGGTGSSVSAVLNQGGTHFAATPVISPLPANSYANILLAGDFNGDGKTDLFFSGTQSSGYLPGRGDGSFASAVMLPSGVTAAVVADFNHDGIADIAGTVNTATVPQDVTPLASSMQVYLGSATGLTLFSSTPLGSGFSGGNLLATSLTNSGNLDLAAFAGTANGDGVYIFRGDGKGGLSAPLTYALPAASTLADFDGDGKLDLVGQISGLNTAQFVYAPGNGDGSFQAQPLSPSTFAGFGGPADFNGDGLTDFLVYDAALVPHVLLGNGDGRFTPTGGALPSGATIALTGDFNGDGKSDALLLNPSTASGRTVTAGTLTYLKGNGDGTFAAGSTVSAGIETLGGAVTGDFNGDGKLDFAAIYSSQAVSTPAFRTPGLAVFLGRGDGTFSAPSLSALTGTPAVRVRSIDLNGDGKDDVVVDSLSRLLSTYLSNGDGTFQAQVPVSVRASGSALADVNHDGIPDLVVVDEQSPDPATTMTALLSVYPGDGHGSFASNSSTSLTFTTDALTAVVTAGDLNADGLPDLVVSSPTVNYVRVLLNRGSGTFTADPSSYYAGKSSYVILGRENAGGSSAAGHTAADLIGIGSDGLVSSLNTINAAPLTVPLVTLSAPVAVGAGTAAALQATVSSPAPAQPTGTVAFFAGVTKLATVDLVNGKASSSVAIPGSGTVVVTAQYSGDTHFASSRSAAAAITVQAAPTVSVTSSAATGYIGQTITYTVTVAGSGAAPTGSVILSGSTVNPVTLTLSGGTATYAARLTAAGTQTITASYSGDAANLPASGTVTQITVPPALVSSSSSAIIVASGSSATVNLSVAAGAGFSGAVTFSCTGLPANAACSFNPANLTLPSTTPVILTLSTSTTTSNSLALPLALGSGGVLICSFLVLPRRRRAAGIAVLGVAASAILVAGVGGCSGGSSGSSTTTTTGNSAVTKTVPGTYTFNVIATAGGVQNSSTYTLTVQ